MGKQPSRELVAGQAVLSGPGRWPSPPNNPPEPAQSSRGMDAERRPRQISRLSILEQDTGLDPKQFLVDTLKTHGLSSVLRPSSALTMGPPDSFAVFLRPEGTEKTDDAPTSARFSPLLQGRTGSAPHVQAQPGKKMPTPPQSLNNRRPLSRKQSLRLGRRSGDRSRRCN